MLREMTHRDEAVVRFFGQFEQVSFRFPIPGSQKRRL
jgi:hypothetical protein